MKIENIYFTGDSYTKPFQSQKYWEFFYIGCHFKSWKHMQSYLMTQLRKSVKILKIKYSKSIY